MRKYETDGQIIFDDGNRLTSGKLTGINLSHDPADWSEGETEFGEVSIVNSLEQIFDIDNRARGSLKKVVSRVFEATSVIVDSFPRDVGNGAIWFYQVTDGANYRCGQLTLCWRSDAGGASYMRLVDNASSDIGDTSAVTLEEMYHVDDRILLEASASSGTWTFTAVRIYLVGKEEDLGQDLITEDEVYLYLSPTGDDDEGDGQVGNPFATIERAMVEADKYWPNNDVGASLRIFLTDGSHTISSPVVLDVIHGYDVAIQAENNTTFSITSVASSGGGAGAYSIVLNVSSVANLDVGDFVNIRDCTGGIQPKLLQGCHEITAVGGSTITVLSTQQYGTEPSGAVAGTGDSPKARITATDCDGFVIKNGRSMRFEDIILEGNGTNRGLVIQGASSNVGGTNVGISYFQDNLVVLENAFAFLPHLCTSNATRYGVYIDKAADANLGKLSTVGNAGFGAYVLKGGILEVSQNNNGVFAGNGDDGLRLEHGGFLLGSIALFLSNDGDGVAGYYGSRIRTTTAESNDNSGDGYYVTGMSYNRMPGSSASGNLGSGYSPAANVVGNEYSLNDM